MVVKSWLPLQDSNLDKLIQSQLCYRYTKRQKTARDYREIGMKMQPKSSSSARAHFVGGRVALRRTARTVAATVSAASSLSTLLAARTLLVLLFWLLALLLLALRCLGVLLSRLLLLLRLALLVLSLLLLLVAAVAVASAPAVPSASVPALLSLLGASVLLLRRGLFAGDLLHQLLDKSKCHDIS